MKSEACENAARHLFGLLAPEDEPLYEAAAAEDPVMREARRLVEELACAVALQAAVPVEPPAHLLPQIKAACGLLPEPAVPGLARVILAWSGWGAAAAVAAAALALWPRPVSRPVEMASGGTTPVHLRSGLPHQSPSPPPATIPESGGGRTGADAAVADAATAPNDTHADVRSENRRLIQELAVLRPELERYRQRDRELFAAVPGRSWPLIVEMHPPGLKPEETPDGILSSAVDGYFNGRTPNQKGPDPVTGSATAPETPVDTASLPPAAGETLEIPRAIPVYDPARDQGTLTVRHLPPPAEGSAYHLWVTAGAGSPPVLAGILPADIGTNDAFDFNLGSTGFVPQSYFLTQDPAGSPLAPAGGNIVLEGP
jgi:hypothetical protein